MCDYIIRHYWDIESKSATLEPQWLGDKIQDLSKERQTIKKIYEQTIGDATRYELLAKSELPEEVIEGYHIRYTYIHKIDPLGQDDKNTRQVTDIEMCITKISKKKLNVTSSIYLVIILLIIILGGYWIVSGSFSNDNRESIVSKIETKQDIKPKTKQVEEINTKKSTPQRETLKEKVCGNSSLNVKLPEECFQQYISYRCGNNETNLSFDKYRKNKESAECTFDNSFIYINNLIKSKKLPLKYKNFFIGENNEKK